MGNPPTPLGDLSPERRRLLELLRRQQEQQGRGAIRALPRTSGTNTFPLSFAQQRLWFIDQFQPGNVFYHLLTAFHLSGPLDSDALQRALNTVIQRHESLRTTFSDIDGQPVQVIAPMLALALPIADLRAVTAQEHEMAIQRSIVEEAQLPFDLANGPLLRVRLLRRTSTEHVLVLTLHHIITDGWSLGVLIRELLTLYQAYTSRRDPALPPLPIQYADFAQWQRNVLQGKTVADQLGYWQQQLADLPKLQLLTDYPRTATTTITGARVLHFLPHSLMQALTALSQHEGTTLFMTLLAALQVLLYRYTGQTDLAVGSGIAGRNRAEIEPLIGFFINTLVLRARMAGNPRFRELLRQVRETTLAAYAHQDLPFEKLVEDLQPERDLGQAPFFQVSFVLHNTPLPELTLPSLTITPIDTEHVTPKLDLSIAIVEIPEGLRARVQYNTELFAEHTITRMMEHFQRLLEGIVANPDQRIAHLPLLSLAEERTLLIDWNPTTVATTANAGFHELFATQAARTPDATALLLNTTQLSYAELDRRANQVAQALRSLGVGLETRVGLAVARSFDLIVGMLGVLKAGGCYVPLDPRYPQARLRLMLEDAQVSVLLTQAELAASLPEHSARVLCLDRDWPWISQHTDRSPDCRVLPDNAAYMIYTSGSTGQPKGVLVAHRGIGNLAAGLKQRIGISAASRVLQFASFSFDGAVAEVAAALLNGATLVLASAEDVQPGPDLVRLLAEQQITTLTLPPSALAVLDPATLAGVTQVLAAGEACPPELVERWSSGRDFFNAYGPTETTVCLTLCRLDGTERVPPLGRPIANTRVYVLDAQFQLVPPGVAGEICASSIGLARGYHQRPDLTAERFIADPFSEIAGSRLYRTGDLGRWRHDGTLEFLGRIDDQVKLRGFRIELGEIETLLGQHPAVREHAVVARSDLPGNLRLVAYVVLSNNQAARSEQRQDELTSSTLAVRGADELQAYLRDHLPDYMVPSAVVILPELPLTPNGKVDRRALPLPEHDRSVAQPGFVAPRTPVEEVIAGVWSSVLGVPVVGVYDNFFALGGHSLLATQVITRLQQLVDQDLPLRLVFEAPTVAAFAERLQGQSSGTSAPLRPVPRDGTPLPLSFAQQRLWFFHQLQPDSRLYTIPVVARLVGTLDRRALEHSLRAIVARHEVLRTTFGSAPNAATPDPWQQIGSPTPMELPLVVLDAAADEQVVHAVVQRLIAQPLDLHQGPLFRATLVQRRDSEHLLVVSIHHSIFDGWSQSVLLRELSALYRGELTKEQVRLPELPIQYADYALWQRHWLVGDVLARQVAYWRQHLQHVSPLELPLDHPRPAQASEQGAQVGFTIAAALHADLQRLSRDLNSTLFMTLLAAWQVVLLRWSGQHDFAVGTPIAGRVRPELEDLIGFFVNTLVLHTDLSGQPSFAELVARVRTTALGAYAHQDVPFEVVVEQLQPARDLGRSPLFQVMFILQNTPRATIDLPGVTLEPLLVEQHSATFELALTLSETAAGLRGQLSYRSDLFAAATIERMALHYQRVLAAAVADPDLRITELPFLDDTERHLLLSAWNATAAAYPQAACLHQLIEAQAARTPDAIAVVYAQQQLTYGELNARAHQLAHALHWHGVKPEHLVGVCSEPSLELVIALLGILKAGGCYVPLDPSYPQERLAFMVEDSRMRIVLTQQHLRQRVAALVETTLCLDQDWSEVAPYATEPPPMTGRSAQLAYMIYTSGSTGTPKGVLVTHRSIVNNLWWRQQTWPLTADDRVLQDFSLSFDPSVSAICWPLIAGARVVLVGSDEHANSAVLARLLDQHAITVYGGPPTLHAAMLQVPELDGQHLRLLYSGGEQLTVEFQQRVFERLDVTLCNMYGPTEATIEATAWVCRQDVADHSVPIGRPIANTQIFLLDERLQPVPIGVPGELCIGGDALARGYLNRPDLTAERFIPHPFAAQHPDQVGGRVYRTGDLARYRADGAIEFLGRIDDQVKLRGARIELGEIEAVLKQHPAVEQAAALVHVEPSGSQWLVAYVVAASQARNPEAAGAAQADSTPSVGGIAELLRPFMEQRIPRYMVPSAFVLLDTLPFTPSGKVDRRALPPFDPAQLQAQRVYTAPQDVLEVQLVRIWEAVLQQQSVGVTDHFFEHGGNSLLAVRLSAQIEQQLGQKIPVAMIFAHPTIRELATVLWERGWPGVLRKVDDLPSVKSPLVAIQPHGTRPPFFFVAPLGGVLPSNILSGLLDIMPYFGADQPYYGVQLPGLAHELVPYLDGEQLLDPAQMELIAGQFAPEASRIEAAAAQCITAMRTIQPTGPYLIGGFCTGTAIAVELAYQLQQQGEVVGLLALVDPPLSLRRQPQIATLEQQVEQQRRDIAQVLVQLNQPRPEQVAWFINRDLGGNRLATDLEAMTARLHELERNEWWRYGAEQLASIDGVMRGIDHQELRRLFMIYQLNTLSLHYVLRHYVPPVYAGPLLVVRAEGMYEHVDHAAAQWQTLTTQSVEIEVVPGDHGTIFHEPNVQVLMQILLGYIARAGEAADVS